MWNIVPYHENQYEVTPRIWLGYVGESGLGAQIRYWTFDEGLAQDAGTFTGNGKTLIGFGMLRANTVDIKTTQEIQWGRWGVNVGGGLRYGSVVQQLSTQIIFPAGPENETLYQAASFFGIGPTLFAEFHRPIGEGGLALVANLRGSLLFGTETNALTITNNLPVPPTTTPYSRTRSGRRHRGDSNGTGMVPVVVPGKSRFCAGAMGRPNLGRHAEQRVLRRRRPDQFGPGRLFV